MHPFAIFARILENKRANHSCPMENRAEPKKTRNSANPLKKISRYACSHPARRMFSRIKICGKPLSDMD
jgi:hypothetical protein